MALAERIARIRAVERWTWRCCIGKILDAASPVVDGQFACSPDALGISSALPAR